jgi:hypothetical protein
MYEYDDVASAYLNRPAADWQRYPCVATAWDNSPRRQAGEALILHNSTPESYGRWLGEAATRQSRVAGRDGIVFINAWNEWAEGAHLEPDVFWGRAYLEMTRDVLRDRFGGGDREPGVVEAIHPQPIPSEELYHDLYEQFVALQDSASGLLSYADRRIRDLKKHYESKLGWTDHQVTQIVDLNEWMAEQLQLQADRMKELATSDVPSTEWLSLRRPASSADDDSTEGPGTDDKPEALSGQRNDEDEDEDRLSESDEEEDGEPLAWLTDEEEQRRDEGYDDPPATRTPQWLVDVDTRDPDPELTG